MKVLSLFSGIGAFEKALDNLQIPYELARFSEIDKYAVKSYCAIHGVDESMNLGDITKIDEKVLPKDIDLITYGFPCQDISLAGKQKGMFNDDGTQTRSGLFFEALRIIEATKPKIAIAENVKNLTGKKFKEQFELVLKSLEEAGYSNYWKVLNAKDYGIPQNRERVFIISIRKDIDDGEFEFPEGFPLELRLKDMLDDEVDEKFYLSTKCIEGFVRHRDRHEAKGTGFKWEVRNPEGVASCLRANSALAPTDNTVAIDKGKPIQVGQIYGTDKEPNPSGGRVYDPDGIMRTLGSGHGMSQPIIAEKPIKVGNTSPSGKSQCNNVYDPGGVYPNICAGTHGNCNPSILVKEATKKGYAEAEGGDSVNIGQPNSKTRRGRVGKQVSQTLTTSGGNEMAVVVDD